MKRMVTKYIVFILLSVFVGSIFAATSDNKTLGDSKVSALQNPVTVLRKTVNALQTEISKQHASLTQSPAKLYAVVQKILMPSIALNQMAAMTLGVRWRAATADQKKEFVTQFSKMLTRTYARSLLQVSDYVITIFPLRNDAWKTATQVALRGKLSPKNSENSSPVTYYMKKVGDTWKIYDFAVEGVSFVKNFQAQFQAYPSTEVLIQKLKALNEKQVNAS